MYLSSVLSLKLIRKPSFDLLSVLELKGTDPGSVRTAFIQLGSDPRNWNLSDLVYPKQGVSFCSIRTGS